MKIFLFIPLSFLVLTLTGCWVYEMGSSGGYADQCNLHENPPWKVSTGAYEAVINGATVHLDARYLYLEETATLIELNAGFSANGKGHTIKFSPENSYIEYRKQKYHPNPGLTENPAMKMHWRCGGTIQGGGDISHCMGAVLTFNKIINKGNDFNLHLGKILIDDVEIDIPDIQFCYIPQKSHISKFHG